MTVTRLNPLGVFGVVALALVALAMLVEMLLYLCERLAEEHAAGPTVDAVAGDLRGGGSP